MSINFPCPECRAQIEVADEFAGLAGQCPRCKQVITIPSPNMPKPRPPVVATPVPARDEWDDPRDAAPRPARTRTRRPLPPRQPAGPSWPWAVGIAGAILVVLLLFISFVVLVSHRPPPPTRPVVFDMQQGVNQQGNGVTVGRLEGQRIFLDNGVFQIRSQLNNNDQPDRLAWNKSRAKQFQIEFKIGVTYVIEVESNDFDAVIRLEDKNQMVHQNGIRVNGLTTIRHQTFTQIMTVWVTNNHQGVGNFTLTVREEGRQRPNVP